MDEPRSLTNPPWHKHLLYGLTNWGLFAAGYINLAIGTWSAANTQVAIAATSLTAGLVLLFAATIDRFESLKGLGVEAKTRQLDHKLEQADITLLRFKELTELTCAALVDLNIKMGQLYNAPSIRESYALAQRVKSIMVAVGLEQAAIRETLKPWARITCHDLADSLVDPLIAALRVKERELIHKRSTKTQQTKQDDPQFLKLNVEINEINTSIQLLFDKLKNFDLDDYPDSFLNIFENVPLLDPQDVELAKAKAIKFAPAMREIRENLQLDNPEDLLQEVEESKKHMFCD